MIRITSLLFILLFCTISASAAIVILPDSELSQWVDFEWNNNTLNSLTDIPGDPGYRYNVTLTGANATEMGFGQYYPTAFQADDVWQLFVNNPNEYAFWVQPFMQVNGWDYRWDSAIDSWIDPGQTVSFALVFDSDVTSVESVGLKIYTDASTGKPNPWTLDIDIVSDAAPKATDPSPADGTGVALSLADLSWTNPETSNPGGSIICDVYISSSDDPNFMLYKTNEKLDVVDSSVLLADLEPPLTLSPNETYYWKVDCHDLDSGGAVTDTYMGDIWNFSTTNIPPVVDAGIKQNVWLSEGIVVVQLDATVTDDGLPNPPAEVQLTWSGSGAFSDDSIEDPTVTFTAAGTYILTLEADDGVYVSAPYASVVTDTVTIAVYAENDDHLIAAWPLDADATDSVAGGDNKDGTLLGDAIIDISESQVGAGSVLLDGDGDLIEIFNSGYGADPNIVTWADLTDEVTLSLWMKSNGFGTWTTIAGKGTVGYRLQQNGSTSSGYFAIGDYNDDTQRDVVGSLNIDDGKWHYLAGTFDGETVRLYVDGILEGQTDALDVIFPRSGDNFKIGDGFNGYIDQVRLHDVGLNGEMILNQFKADGGNNSCAQKYTITDLNQDCYVNIADFALFVMDWLECHDITNPNCDPILP